MYRVRATGREGALVVTLDANGLSVTAPYDGRRAEEREYDRHAFYVSISDADRDRSLDYVATVYNGIRLADFTFRAKPGEYAVVLGRIHPDKGVHLAIEAATAAGLPLIIAGIVQDTDYFRRHVEPRLDGDRVRFLGPVGPAERDSLLGGALALLHLVTFDEPFGLAMIEAMACGTPVIGMRRGAVPEVVVDGQTGVLVGDVGGAVRALRVVAGLDRGRCRTRVEERFTVDTMVRGYLDVYAEVLERWPSRRD